MNVVRFELIELPYPTLARFGLTQEMIEDLPMRVLDEICDGRHSPVLPVRVRDEKGELIESRSRFALVRRDDGLSDVVFIPSWNPRHWNATTRRNRNNCSQARRFLLMWRRQTDGTARHSCR